MKQKSTKKFLLCSMILILVLALGVTAWAATGERQLAAVFRDIQLIVNGQTVTPTDANGQPVEPFLVDGTTYLPVRAVGDALGLEVAWHPDTNTVTLSGAAPAAGGESTADLSAEVSRNLATVRAFLAESSNAAWADYFAEGALYQYSGGASAADVSQAPASEWLEGLAEDFRYRNAYASDGVEPIFTPVNSDWNNTILYKADSTWTEDGEQQQQYWILEFNFDSAGKISRFRTVKDVDEAIYLELRADGAFDYTSQYDAASRRLLNLRTIDLWWACQDLDRNIQRLILVTDDAIKLMSGNIQIMYITDDEGNFVEGWLNPDQSGSFPQWGFFAEDLTSPPDKLFECADLPDVYLVDGFGNGIWIRDGVATDSSPNYYLQFTMRDDGKIVNFRELSHGLHTLPAL